MNNAPRNLRLLQTFPTLPNRFCAETAAIRSELVMLYNPGVRMLEVNASGELLPAK